MGPVKQLIEKEELWGQVRKKHLRVFSFKLSLVFEQFELKELWGQVRKKPQTLACLFITRIGWLLNKLS